MIALLLLSLTTTITVPCELIEFNTVVREDCEPFQQVIFWGWSHRDNCYNARGWVGAENVTQLSPTRIKYRRWIIDGPIRFTETIGDPELENRRTQTDTRPMPWMR